MSDSGQNWSLGELANFYFSREIQNELFWQYYIEGAVWCKDFVKCVWTGKNFTYGFLMEVLQSQYIGQLTCELKNSNLTRLALKQFDTPTETNYN